MAKVTKLKKAEELSDAKRRQIIDLLITSYNMELETVVNYLACSTQLDGVLAKGVKASLDADVTEELGHAKLLAARIKVLGGNIPGSLALKMTQKSLQPPKDGLDVESVIRGVIEAEDGAIDQYQRIIEATGDDADPVTQDLAVELKGDEEEHRREFLGFLREWQSFGLGKK
jgi:bacterioferritin